MTEARNAGTFPDVFLLVNGREAFKREFEMPDREVEELAATGLSFGVHVAVAANRWAEIRPALLDNLGTRLELKLHDAIDSLVSRQAASSLPAEVPGRGLTSDALHFHVALPRVDGRAEEEGVTAAIGALMSEAADHWSDAPTSPIRLLPRELDPRQLPPPSAREGVPFGVEERGLDPVWIRLAGPTRTSSSSATARARSPRFLRGLGRGLIAAYVVLFDDYDLVTGPTGGPLAPLLDVLAVGGDVGLHVVLARRVGGSARGAYEAVFGRLRELGSPGVLLSGDPGEGPLLGGTSSPNSSRRFSSCWS